MKYKKAQEEMFGFALIIIVVAVILLFLLTFSSQTKKSTESLELESFTLSLLSYTSDCSQNSEYLSIRDLIFECIDFETCIKEEEISTCEVLNENIEKILEKSWIVGNNSVNKAYEFEILSENEQISYFSKGNKTSTYKGNLQNFARSGNSIDISFRIYS